MKITYDSETDTLTVVLRDATAWVSEEEKSRVILDYDGDERLVEASRSSMPRPR